MKILKFLRFQPCYPECTKYENNLIWKQKAPRIGAIIMVVVVVVIVIFMVIVVMIVVMIFMMIFVVIFIVIAWINEIINTLIPNGPTTMSVAILFCSICCC